MRALPRPWLVIAVAAVLTLCGRGAPVAAAEDACPGSASVSELAEAGLRAYRAALSVEEEAQRTRGLERAVRCYQRAQGKSQISGAKLYHPLGLAYEKLHRDAKAAAAFSAFLREVPEVDRLPGVTNQVAGKLAALLRTVGQLSINAPAGAALQVDGQAVGVAPLGYLLPVEPGPHVVAALPGAGEGRSPLSATVNAAPGVVTAVELLPLVAQRPAEAPREAGLTQAVALASAASPPAAPTPLYKRWWLWTAVGAATAGVVVGVTAGVLLSHGGDAPPITPEGVRDLNFALRF